MPTKLYSQDYLYLFKDCRVFLKCMGLLYLLFKCFLFLNNQKFLGKNFQVSPVSCTQRLYLFSTNIMLNWTLFQGPINKCSALWVKLWGKYCATFILNIRKDNMRLIQRGTLKDKEELYVSHYFSKIADAKNLFLKNCKVVLLEVFSPNWLIGGWHALLITSF